MLNSHQVMLLYTKVFEDILLIKGISEKDIKQAIDNMHKTYQGSTNNLSKNLNSLTDYNTVTYRCAYLFKYAPFHTALAYKAMSHALTENPYELQAALDSLSGPLKLCSLGGGPGTDMIGVLAALHDKFGFFPISAKLVDIMSEWELTFRSVVDELRFGEPVYGSLPESLSEKWFDWSFIAADLQSKMSKELAEALGSADIITMVKFVSAAACKETSNMIEKIFRIMKPGAFLLFVDNAGGGFEQLISSAASKYKLNAVFKPLKHQHYTNDTFYNIKYGYRSCYESKVAVQLLMKPISMNYTREINFVANPSCIKNFPSASVPFCQKMRVSQYQNFRTGPNSVNLINEHESPESGSPYNLHGSNFSPLDEFSPRMGRHQAQINNHVNLHNSFESNSPWSSSPHSSSSLYWPLTDENQNYDSEYQNESFEHEMSLDNGHYNSRLHWNLPLNSTPQDIPLNRRPLRAVNQVYDPAYGKELVECNNSFNASINNSLLPTPVSTNNSLMQTPVSTNNSLLPTPASTNNSLLPTPVSQAAHIFRLNITATDDSGYPVESFESELSQDSSICNSPLPFRTSERLIRFRKPERKVVYSTHEDESFWNKSFNRLPQHAMQMHHDEDSFLSPVPYRPNFQQLEKTTNRSFKLFGDSGYNQSPINSESPLYQSWSSNHHPNRIFQYSDKYKTPKEQNHVSVFPHEPYEVAKSWTNQSENGSPLLLPPCQHPGKNKAPKRHINASMLRHKPYQQKKFRI